MHEHEGSLINPNWVNHDQLQVTFQDLQYPDKLYPDYSDNYMVQFVFNVIQ